MRPQWGGDSKSRSEKQGRGPRSRLSHLCVRADHPLSEGLTMAQWDPKVGSTRKQGQRSSVPTDGITGTGAGGFVPLLSRV